MEFLHAARKRERKREREGRIAKCAHGRRLHNPIEAKKGQEGAIERQ